MRVYHRQSRRRGISLIEVSISSLIAGLVCAAGTATLAHVTMHQATMKRRQYAVELARDLMTEILAKEYRDPTVTTTLLTFDAGESASNRTTFDDVDDYSGLDDSPMKMQDGTSIANATGWKRSCVVAYLSPADLTSVLLSDQGLKVILVRVHWNNQIVIEWSAIKADVSKQTS